MPMLANCLMSIVPGPVGSSTSGGGGGFGRGFGACSSFAFGGGCTSAPAKIWKFGLIFGGSGFLGPWQLARVLPLGHEYTDPHTEQVALPSAYVNTQLGTGNCCTGHHKASRAVKNTTFRCRRAVRCKAVGAVVRIITWTDRSRSCRSKFHKIDGRAAKDD